MEKYKKTLRIRIALFGSVILLNAVLSICQRIMDDWVKIPADLSSITEFLSGFLMGLAILSLLMLIKYRKLLRDERSLRESYNRETDERMVLIRSKAGMPALLITSIVMIFAGIFGGYYNIIIFYTLLAAGLCQILLGVCLKFYYMHKL